MRATPGSVCEGFADVFDFALQIDSADPEAIEKSLRIYNGKALINSVNGKEEDMKKIFPLAKKYGGVLVALTLDEDGIPETAQGRLAIARRIIETAAKYGIEKKNIIVDALTMTVGASADAAKITLDSLALIKKSSALKQCSVFPTYPSVCRRGMLSTLPFLRKLFAGGLTRLYQTLCPTR